MKEYFNILKNKVKTNFFTKLLIVSFLLVSLLKVTLIPTTTLGESDDYMIAAISMERHFSTRITEEDIKQAQIDYQGIHADKIKKTWKTSHAFEGLSGAAFIRSAKNGEFYPFYFPTYSVASIPMKKLLKSLHLNQAYAFVITNVLMYFLALCFVYKYLAADKYAILLTVMSLIVLPIHGYLLWQSAEIFIFSLMVCAAVSYCNKHFVLSSFFLSIAGTLNPTVMFMAVFTGFSFFYENIKKYDFNFLLMLKSEYIAFIKISFSYVPFLLSLLYYYLTLGMLFPQSGSAASGNLMGRFSAYLFDLNLGFLPYLPITLLLLFVCLVLSIYKKNFVNIFFIFGFFATILGYSLHHHINCGMSYIARYNAWLTPVLIMAVTVLLPRLFSQRLKLPINICIIIAIILAGLLNTVDIKTGNTGYSERISSQARFIFDNFPALYNPYPYTFIARTSKVHGGYWTNEQDNTTYNGIPIPFIYKDKEFRIKKILVPRGYAYKLEDMLTVGKIEGDEKSLNYLREQIQKLSRQTENFKYISIPRGNTLYLRPSDMY